MERGVAGVTMEGIAAKAGVNKALPYRHFDNADAVLVELFVRFNRVLATRVLEAIASADDLDGRVRATVSAYFSTVKEHKALLSVVMAPDSELAGGALAEMDAASFVDSLMVDAFGVSKSVARPTGDVVLGILATAARSWADRSGSRKKLEALAVAACLGVLRPNE